VLVAVVAGGPLVDAALLAPAGTPLQVTPAVRLAPLGGWRLAATQRGGRPALLTRGSGSLAVLSVATGVDQRELADAYVREYLAPASANLVVTAAQLVRSARHGWHGASPTGASSREPSGTAASPAR
jgi:hypothetical protein